MEANVMLQNEREYEQRNDETEINILQISSFEDLLNLLNTKKITKFLY